MRTECNISIVGRNELVREGLRRILAEDGFEFTSAVATYNDLPDMAPQAADGHIFLIDVASSAEALAAARALRTRFDGSRLVFMADDVSIEAIAAAFGEGIDGYVIKSISCEPLKNALRMVACGEKVFPSQLASALTATVWKLPSGNWDIDADLNLSAREIEILRCLVSGHSNKVIARQLSITEATVKVHVKAVLRKLRVANRTQAAIWAFTRGLNEAAPVQDELLRPAAVVPARGRPHLRVAV